MWCLSSLTFGWIMLGDSAAGNGPLTTRNSCRLIMSALNGCALIAAHRECSSVLLPKRSCTFDCNVCTIQQHTNSRSRFVVSQTDVTMSSYECVVFSLFLSNAFSQLPRHVSLGASFVRSIVQETATHTYNCQRSIRTNLIDLEHDNIGS